MRQCAHTQIKALKYVLKPPFMYVLNVTIGVFEGVNIAYSICMNERGNAVGIFQESQTELKGNAGLLLQEKWALR